MRTIKFRGLRIDGKGWIYGFYVFRPDGKHLIYWKPFEESTNNTYHEVIPESVGQFTGLLDKDGKGVEMYQDDIVMYHYDEDDYYGVIHASMSSGITIKDIGKVHFRGTEHQRLVPYNPKKDLWSRKWSKSEVIGNIHQNPELL